MTTRWGTPASMAPAAPTKVLAWPTRRGVWTSSLLDSVGVKSSSRGVTSGVKAWDKGLEMDLNHVRYTSTLK